MEIFLNPAIMYYKVTVITVVKNAEKVIQSLINSVREYKSEDVEFLILDGLSSDNTVEILKQNEDVVDRWLSEPDVGIYDAMNKAVKLARGEWLIFMGADDELLEGFHRFIPFLKKTNTIYYGKVFFHGKVFTGKIKNNRMLLKTNICHQAIFYHKNVFEKYNYQVEYVKCADYVLNLKLWADRGFTFAYRDFLIAKFAIGGFSSHTEDPLFELERENLFRIHLGPFCYYRKKASDKFRVIKNLFFNK